MPDKRHLRIALLTSPLLGALVISPPFIVADMPWRVLPISFGIFTVATFAIWQLNFGLHARFGERRWLHYLSAYAIVAGVAVAVRLAKNPPFEELSSIPIIVSVIAAVSINTLILILYELLLLRDSYIRAEQENNQLRINQIETRLQLLRNQLHPHFLFNALGTLKTLIRRRPEQAQTYLVALSDFLRASLLFDSKRLISLREDWGIALNYLQLQGVRFGRGLEWEWKVDDTAADAWQLPPFTLQLLAENAVKHNRADEEQPLRICIETEDADNRILQITNNLQPKAALEAGSGIGLQNLGQRLTLLGGSPPEIVQNQDAFCVRIRCL